MEQVTDKIHKLGELVFGGVGVFAIEGDDGITLVDTGVKFLTFPVWNRLKAKGWHSSDIKRILITHVHPDHTGGLSAVYSKTKAEIICSPLAAKKLSKPIARQVNDGDTLDGVLDGLQVVATPGHTNGHLSFYHTETETIIAGDAIANVAGLRLLMPPLLSYSKEEAVKSVKRLAALNPKILAVGHGGIVRDNTADKLNKFAETL